MKLTVALTAVLVLALCRPVAGQTYVPPTQFMLPCLSYDGSHSVGLCADGGHSLTGGDWTSKDSIYVAGYWNTGDGGGGVFVRNNSGTCSPNAGTVVQDNATSKNCWYRQNTSGDLRQWGITRNSKYDMDIVATGTVSTDASSLVSDTALPDLAKIGITNVTLNQVNVYFGAKSIEVPITTSIGCGATGGEQISGPHTTTDVTPGFLHRPGTIYLAHGAYVHFQNSDDASFIHNCLILPAWLAAPGQAAACLSPLTSFVYPAAQYSDIEAVRANMIICHDKAVFWESSSGGTSHDVWAFGFDNPFYFLQSDHTNLFNSAADGNICYYTTLGGGNTQIENSYCGGAVTGSTPKDATSTNNKCYSSQNPTNNLICNSEYWQIGNIVHGNNELLWAA